MDIDILHAVKDLRSVLIEITELVQRLDPGQAWSNRPAYERIRSHLESAANRLASAEHAIEALEP